MSALTADRDTQQKDNEVYDAPVAASTKIYGGALVALDASGNAVPGSTATTLKGYGRADGQADNSGGSAGDITVRVEKGVFCFDNSASGDLLARADIGNNCYIVDDHTVAKTSASSTRSVAGVVVDVTTRGVWVKFS